MTVSDGGRVSSSLGYIAGYSGWPGSGSEGHVTVTGAGSTWASTSSLYVGYSGTGTLTVSNGGKVSDISGYIGNVSSSEGHATVTGAGSTWTNTGSLSVGDGGTGTLTIKDGGKVSNTISAIGYRTGSNGAVTVSGAGSTWTNSSLVVGGFSTGTLTVEKDGLVKADWTIVGDGAGSTGTISLIGTAFDGRGVLETAYVEKGTGKATLDLNGGILRATQDESDFLRDFGALTVGANGAWFDTNGHAVTIDGGTTFSGSGSFNKIGDGTLTLTGDSSGFAGSATVDGGTLEIAQGGKLGSSFGYLGSGTGSNGTVMVSGVNSTWKNAGSLNVGYFGTGTLTIEDGGEVSSTTGYIGNSTNSNGTVMVSGAGSTWINTGFLTIGDYSAGTLTVSAGGKVSALQALLGWAGGSSGTLNIGAAAGDAAVAAGIMDTASIQFRNGTGTLNFNHTGAIDFAPILSSTGSGTHALNHYAGITTLTGDSSAFTGTTTVSGGTLLVGDAEGNGKLGGTVYVSDDGTLGGTGSIGNLLVNGTVAPGNSIGTLNVGSVTFNTGSIYQVEVNVAGQSDKLAATGTATINGGGVQVLAGSGNYAPQTKYTILTAAGGRTGIFTEDPTSNLAFLDPSLSYDANNVYLTMSRNDISFAGIGVTPNQIAAASGVESLTFGSPVYDAVLNLSAPQARGAFDALSGEIHASAMTAMIEDSRFVRSAVNDRIRAAFDGVGASGGTVATYIDGQPVAAAATTDGLAVWGQGFGSWGHWNSDGNAAKLDRSIGGFFFGADAPVFNTWRFGAVAGYSRTDFKTSARLSSGISDNYHVGLYGGTTWGDLAFRTGATYTWHDISTARNVAFPGFGDSLEGDYNAGTAQVFGEVGYRMQAANVAFEPFANLAYVNLHADGFTEKGGAAALTSGSSNTDTTFSTLGLRASTTFDLSGVAVTAKGTLGWRHAFGDTAPEATMRFAAGGDPFTIAGVPIARDAAIVEAGLNFNLSPNAVLGVSHGGQFGSGVTDQTFRASFNVKF